MLVIVHDENTVSPLGCAELTGVGDTDILGHRQRRKRSKCRDGAGHDGVPTTSVCTPAAIEAISTSAGCRGLSSLSVELALNLLTNGLVDAEI